MDIAHWCNRIIKWTFAMLFILVPFVMTSVNYELFEYNKMMLTYGLAAVIITAWIIKMVAEREIKIARTPLDIPIAIFFISQIISTLFSIDPHVSWFGYYSRFNGGMASVITYILLFYAFVSNWSEWNHLTNVLKLTVATAVVVALYGALEHFGYSLSCLIFSGKFDVTCWVQDVQNRVFATLGQPNWLAAYLAALIPVSLALAIRKSFKTVEFWVWMIVSAVFFAVLLFTKSRSGLGGFAVADLIFLALTAVSAFRNAKHEDVAARLFLPMVFVHLLFAASIIFFGSGVDVIDKYVSLHSIQSRLSKSATGSAEMKQSAVKTDTLLSTGGTESGTIRKYVWEGAIAAWKSSVKTFMIGTGTETFAFAFYQFKPAAHNLTSEWDFLYNKAHNEYLNYLTTTGIVGLGSYLLFIGAFLLWFSKFSVVSFQLTNTIPIKHFKIKIDEPHELLVFGLFAGWISILVTNFFGFSVVITQLFLFLFPAMVFAVAKTDMWRIKPFKIPANIANILLLTTLIVGLLFLFFIGRTWYADTLYAKGYNLNRFGKAVEAKGYLTEALHINPTEPVFYDEDSVILAELAAANLEEKDATTAAVFAKQSLAESDKALAISPNNVNFWKSRTKIFYAFTQFDPQFTKAAIEALMKAQKLSPTDPKITYNLAILYGKLGDNTSAIKLLRNTITLKPNYREAYAAIIIFYKETREFDLAKQVLQEYLSKVDPQDKDFRQQLLTL